MPLVWIFYILIFLTIIFMAKSIYSIYFLKSMNLNKKDIGPYTKSWFW